MFVIEGRDNLVIASSSLSAHEDRKGKAVNIFFPNEMFHVTGHVLPLPIGEFVNGMNNMNPSLPKCGGGFQIRLLQRSYEVNSHLCTFDRKLYFLLDGPMFKTYPYPKSQYSPPSESDVADADISTQSAFA